MTVIRAPDVPARPLAMARTPGDGWSVAGAQIRTSMPSRQPVTSSEFAVLLRPSPR